MKNLKQVKNLLPLVFRRKNLFFATLAMGITLFCLNLNLFSIEALFYDGLMKFKGTEHLDPRIKIKVLDHATLAKSNAVLNSLANARPRSIVFFNKFDPSEIEAEPQLANEFVANAKKLISLGTQLIVATDIDLTGEVLPPFPISTLPHAPAVIHKDGTVFSQDKVVRRGLLTVFNEPSVYSLLAHPQKSKTEVAQLLTTTKGAYFFEPAESWHFLIRYPGDTATTSSVFSEAKISPSENLTGSIVLIDSLEKDAPSDYYFTPYSRISYTNPRINIHAAIVNSLISNTGISQVPTHFQYALTFLLALAAVFLSVYYPPLRSTIYILCTASLLLLSSLALFSFFGFWLKLAQPVAAIASIYYIVMPYRAILEYRKRWEVQEKHDILVQVEELKGNFLSLMSHDLKTPVARIQGLTEHILRKNGLTEQQQNEVRQILDSTEALDKFISKILNLTKIESENIKLNRKSKDLNQLIEKCTEKLTYQAQRKNVRLELELEPLFPVQVDAALMIQVLTNIIDNAINYSPAGSTVTISTKEEGDSVSISIADNGPGMDKSEQKQLFTKFFRGNALRPESAKGSGLGLYLSKYFIELHNGSISVSSAKGEGSRFLISLPNNSVIRS